MSDELISTFERIHNSIPHVSEVLEKRNKEQNNKRISQLYTICERIFEPDDYIWELLNLIKDSANQDVVPDLTELQAEITNHIKAHVEKKYSDQAIDNSFAPSIQQETLDQAEAQYEEEQDAIYQIMNERRLRNT